MTISSLTKKPKVLVFTHSGGGGHEAAAKAVEKALEKTCKVAIEHPFAKLSGDTLFNYFQSKGRHNALRLLTSAQRVCEIGLCPLQARPLIANAIKKHKPDIIISVCPVANYLTHRIAAAKRIPFLVIPTDLEARHFFHFIRNPDPKYFQVGLAFNDPLLKKQLHGNALRGRFTNAHFAITGYPLRAEFSAPKKKLKKQIAALQEKLHIQPGEKIVLIMMGAQGVGNTILEDATRIANTKCPKGKKPQRIRVLCLCGNKKELIPQLKRLNKYKKNPLVTIQGLPKQDAADVSALMHLADCMITKPGGSTVNELFATKLKTLFHCEGVHGVPWEAYNEKYAEKKGLGTAIDKKTFIYQLYTLLSKRGRAKTPNCPGTNFAQNLKATVYQMLVRARPSLKRSPYQNRFF